MKKIKLTNNVFTPMPVCLVGAVVNNKPNFLTVGWVSRVNAAPPMIMVALNHSHYTNLGISQNKTFSVSIPSAKLIDKTDYCGIKSGKIIDKSELFTVVFGELETAPMIAECPINIECKLISEVELPSNTVFIGEIVNAYVDEQCLTNDKPDYKKMEAVILTMPDNNYWKIGENVAKAWSIGKTIE